MKHIFFVHTPVTYLGAVAVIQHLNLTKQEAIIFFQSFKTTAAENSNLYSTVSIEAFFSEGNFFKKISSVFTGFGISKKFDKLVSEAVKGEKFIAYIPVVTFIHKLLITHQKCAGFNFIEEGLAQYYKEDTLESINPLYSKKSWRSSLISHFRASINELYLLARGYNFKLLSLPFSYSCYHAVKGVQFYGYSTDSFPLAHPDRRTILPLISNNAALLQQALQLNLDNSFIWIGDPGVIHHGFSKQIYLQGITDGCISFLKEKNIHFIFIKFHRDEPMSLRKEVEKLFLVHEIETVIIPDTAIMELYLATAVNASLFGIYSSLLYYAAIMGHTSYSVFNYVKSEYNKAVANRDLGFFWQKVQLLKH